MFNKCLQYKKVLKKIKKNELNQIIDDYNKLCNIYNLDIIEYYKNKKKDDLINIIDNFKVDYIKCIICSLDIKDYNVLKTLINKKNNIEYINSNKEFIEYLLSKYIIFKNDSLEIPIDIFELIKNFIKDKNIKRQVLENDKIYKYFDGLIIAYGVIDRKVFKNLDDNINLIEYYYKKDYNIEKLKIVSKKLSNKERINRYFKDIKYKEFSDKELIELGSNTYHKKIKAYKKFISILKSNYVFRESDIEYVDKNIVIPYLYNSLNEEDIAHKNLENTINDLFEFKSDKLKNKMIEEIEKIRDEFPLWEYRGFSKEEII